MLTIFSIPKTFHEHIGVIQRNAIASWFRSCPSCEVLLFGEEKGTADAAAEFGARHIEDVARNEYGTPRVDDLFEKAARGARGELLCYVNADIILTSDLLSAVSKVRQHKSSFLMVGQRWDAAIDQPLDFEPGWESRLRRKLSEEWTLHGATGIDYFVFTRGVWDEIPPFAIGRTAWDNWLIYRARARDLPVIDATRVVTAVHQNHDYAHIPGGMTEAWTGAEARRNLELAGGYDHVFTILDANLLLTRWGLLPAWTPKHLRQRIERWPFVRAASRVNLRLRMMGGRALRSLRVRRKR